MKDSDLKPSPKTECQHPADRCETETLGYMDFYAGEIADSLRQVVICKECGAVLYSEDASLDEGLIF